MNKSKTQQINKIKIFISGTNGLTAQYGGWDQIIRNVSEKLSEEYFVICHGSFYDANSELDHRFKSKVKLFKIKANGLSSIIFDLRCLIDAYSEKGICLMMGTSGGIFFPIFKLLGLKIILNPDGYEWRRSKWNKLVKIFLFVSDYLAINFSDLIVCDHPVRQKRDRKISNTRTIYIPYGGDNAKYNLLANSSNKIKSKIEDKNYFFKVCRIEPENNIELIIKACILAKVNLVVVGNWHNSKYGINLKDNYTNKKFQNIFLIDPIYDPDELGALRSNCLSYIHGHTVGGTNPSLVEAMWLGLDIICHDNEFNQFTTDFKATYFKDLNQLVYILKFKSNKKSYKSCGKKMKEIAKRKYTHEIISQNYLEAVNSL